MNKMSMPMINYKKLIRQTKYNLNIDKSIYKIKKLILYLLPLLYKIFIFLKCIKIKVLNYKIIIMKNLYI
jgi:hypothetical protein